MKAFWFVVFVALAASPVAGLLSVSWGLTTTGVQPIDSFALAALSAVVLSAMAFTAGPVVARRM